MPAAAGTATASEVRSVIFGGAPIDTAVVRGELAPGDVPVERPVAVGRQQPGAGEGQHAL